MTILAHTPEWYAWRRVNITSTDVAAIMGQSRYGTPRSVWMRLTGRAEPEPVDTPDARWGLASEDANARLYQQETGRWVDRNRGGVLVVHPDIPWLGCTPDGVACQLVLPLEPPIAGSEWLWEAKAPRRFSAPEAAEEGLKADHYWQLVCGMACTGMPRASLSTLVPPLVYWQDMERDLVSEKRMVEALEHFRETYWLKDKEPPVTALDEAFLRREHPASEERTVELTSELVELTWQVPKLEGVRDEAQARIDAIRARIMREMGTAERAIGPEMSWSWKQGKKARPLLLKIGAK